MKEIVIKTSLLVICSMLISCKKEYNCHCVEVLSAGAGGTFEYSEIVEARNVEEAKEECASLNVSNFKTCEYKE